MSGRQYSRELLAEAAARSSTIDGAIDFLDTPRYGRLRRYLFARFAHFGIDVSHFPQRGPRGTIPRPTPDELRRAVEESTSIAAALRALRRNDNSRARQQFRQWLDDDGVDTSHFTGQAHQRGKRSAHRNPPQIVLVKRDTGRRKRTSALRQALDALGIADQCAECGTGPCWNGRPMTLEIDHINGDPLDDRSENLRLLCPNCHATTVTWCRGGRHRPPPG